ncbi:MAG: response regulator transcription factor [Elusimicrobia bacterium]|nr:response regulator transcription factor [Elusimicrobiota bacterium]
MSAKPLILVVDDDEGLVDLLASYLRNKGFEVSTASNGDDALAIARARKPDVILLDVMMPGMDGYHAAAHLCEQARGAPPRIIMVSGRDMSAEEGIARFSGAAAVVQKPFNMPALHATIRRVLEAAPPPAGA